MSYLDVFLKSSKLEITLKLCESTVRHLDFDTIAVRGNSGLLLGSPLAIKMKKDLLIIRKDSERSHSGNKVEGWGFRQKILIVDDFIETGNTIDDIYESIAETCDSYKIRGILLYGVDSRYPLPRHSYTHPDGTTFKIFPVERPKLG